MKHYGVIKILTFSIVIFSAIASSAGIFIREGAGAYKYESIRGRTVTIYGKGIYRHMSAEVAPQGIAQDYITLFAGIPLLLFSFFKLKQGSLRGKYLFTGTTAYFLVTYLFYTVMGMYNSMYLIYVLLLGASFYNFILSFLSFETRDLMFSFNASVPVRTTGSFLIINSVGIALLWLSIVVPPLLNGTVIPLQTEHYTTLVVQGLDLGILLPASFISGLLWIRKKPLGYLLAPVYFIFLSLLMTALSAKVIAMKILGYNVIPAIFIIPTFNLISIICTMILLRSIQEKGIIK